MRFKFSSIIVLLLFSCSNRSIPLSKGEGIFVDQLLNKVEKLQTDNHVVFILNQSFCAPCEEEVRKFYSGKYGKYRKLFVVPETRKPIQAEEKNYVSFLYQDMARYGVVRTNGTVLLFKGGNCVLLESIDVQNIEELKVKIDSLIRN